MIGIDNLIRDLKYWETLLVSSMMQRPIQKLIDIEDRIVVNDEESYIWDDLQQRNLKSAVAFAALTTKTGTSEHELYENIVEIPHYESKWLQLLDREDEKVLVKENFKDFRDLYVPIIKDNFSDCFEINDKGEFIIDTNDSASRRHLIRHLNDNVFQNIQHKVIGTRNYQKTDSKKTKLKKDPLETDQKEEIADDILSHPIPQQQKVLNVALDKILATHRNSRLFLFMLTAPFFIFFMVFKYSIKGVIIMHFWRKRKLREQMEK